ncbi:hypothetical protein [Streptomyces sp. CB01580]|uniref:hypothetical protein n=1 Tax=Streptomyces sp. CB01580 TaxID=1703933 RepID=UPI00093F1D98|nr:hypothetical protein [Streptomyces sp. CB01580]OKJ18417.1 hypothetical protein AMK22_35510 [Streptomyces sp. CB01580]
MHSPPPSGACDSPRLPPGVRAVVAPARRRPAGPDWHVSIGDPDRGALGYCTGTGPDETFDPDAANRVLEQGGCRVTGPWTEVPPTGDAPFTVTVEKASA